MMKLNNVQRVSHRERFMSKNQKLKNLKKRQDFNEIEGYYFDGRKLKILRNKKNRPLRDLVK